MAAKIFEIVPNSLTRNLAIGVFDGVHLGHKEILRETLRDLADPQEAAVLTFEPHPLQVIAPQQAPPRLTTAEKKVALLQSYGVEQVMVAEFNAELRLLTPEGFVDQLHRLFPLLVEVIVGPNWGFGHGRNGNIDTMRQLGLGHGFFTRSLKPFSVGGQPVSSTRIREAILRRAFDEANSMLGYSYAVTGVVMEGDHRGRKIGFPTANIGDISQLMPPRGVYAGFVSVEGVRYPSVMNYGVRPTIQGGASEMLEAHLIGFAGEIYGRPVEVGGFVFIREEKAFPSLEELKNQIEQDLKAARDLLKL